MRQLLKSGWNHMKGYGVMGVNLVGVSDKFSAPPHSGETMLQTPPQP